MERPLKCGLAAGGTMRHPSEIPPRGRTDLAPVFDQAQHAGIYHQDWRLEGDLAAIAAFRRELAIAG